MPKLTTELPEELVRQVEEIARQFNQSPAEIIERALDQFVHAVGEVRATAASRRAAAPTEADWAAIKRTLTEASCPFEGCPFAGDCPVELCPL